MTITQEGMESHGAEFRFNVDRFGITDPANTTVYYRDTIGKGAFYPLRTRYNPNTRELVVDTAQVGEFCFGSPITPSSLVRAPRPLTPIGGVKVSDADPVTLHVSPQGVYSRLRYLVTTTTGQRVLDTLVARDRFVTLKPLAPGRYSWNTQAVVIAPDGTETGRSELSPT